MINLDSPIKNLPRLIPKYLKPLNRVGILTIRDLLFYLPFRYDDYSNVVPISDLAIGQVATAEGKITKIKNIRTWKKRMFITEVLISDDSGSIRATWFNQPFLMNSLIEGKEIRISGKISSGKNGSYFSNPAWEMAKRDPTNTGRLVPVYPETAGLTSKWLRWQIQLVLKNDPQFADPLPEEIIKKLGLPSLEKAIRYIHFPENKNQYLVAQKRFAFEEMLLLQIKSLQVRDFWKREKSVTIKFDEGLIKKFVSALPFQLTNAQRKASFEILKDLEKMRPMNRLLNGDVGSGKTIVAAISALQTISAGYQTAIMAPTEVLALQHFGSLIKIFQGRNIRIALLTNSYQLLSDEKKKIRRSELLKQIKNKSVDLVIGTHALIQKDVHFKNLALVIVDEQHRFGVAQRAYLQQEVSGLSDGVIQKIPHFLTMTATPIPRTLALAFFGNLDLSILDEMPKDRKKIITQIVSPTGRNKIYDFIRTEITKGRQCFVILPLVEESKALAEVKAATQEYERLSKEIFPDLNIGLVHGRMKSAEKEKAMLDFKEKRTAILVATAVVEVGIDIPNATAMIIEDADRFGLSQLHQFRGRIGRGEHQSYCFLFTQSSGATAKKRLEALVESENGFKIAEKDLELRGPGEFLGTRQSGIPDISMENLTNVKLIQIAREEAQSILQSDPQLKKHPLLADALQKFNQTIHLE